MGAGVVAVLAGGGSDDDGGSVQRLERASVLITSKDERGQPTGIGSGSIISRSGLILTNAHVAAPAAAGRGLASGTTNEDKDPAALVIGMFRSEDEPVENRYTAHVVAVDGYADIAVLQIDATTEGEAVSAGQPDLPTVPLGQSDALENGEELTVVGFPGIGGGFEGAIDVVEGNVAGFQRDARIPDRRGWVKTDAEISFGNSGGLAANDDGELVGIPTVIEPDRNQAGTTKGKLRPLKLALPVISAARDAESYESPYFVAGTGAESGRFVGWAASSPDGACRFQRVDSYPAGTRSLTAVFDVDGLAPGVDISAVWVYQKDEAGEPDVLTSASDVWRLGSARSTCFRLGYPGQGAGPVEDGHYLAVLMAGPNLKQIGAEVVTVGGSGSQPSAAPSPTTGTGTGAAATYCGSWSPEAIAGSGVDLDAAALQNGVTIAEGGRFALSQAIGNPGGYATAAEADQVAAGAVRPVFEHANYRWIVVEHQARYYAYAANLYSPLIFTPSAHVNPAAPPCLMQRSQGAVVAWHALRFTDGLTVPQYVRYDWSAAAGGRFQLLGPTA